MDIATTVRYGSEDEDSNSSVERDETDVHVQPVPGNMNSNRSVKVTTCMGVINVCFVSEDIMEDRLFVHILINALFRLQDVVNLMSRHRRVR